MIVFRVLLAAYLVALLVYIGAVGTSQGWDMMPTFVGDLTAVNWAGQISVEFIGYYMLSILWVVWRHKFSVKGFLLGLIMLSISMVFLMVYLIYLSFQCRGDVKQMLVGDR